MKDLVHKFFDYQTKEEKARKSFILKVILAGNILLFLVAIVVNLILKDNNSRSLLEQIPAIFLVILLGLFQATRKGYSKLVSYILIFFITIPSYYLAYGWGTTISNSWIGLILSVVMGGILIHSRFSLILITIHSIVLISFTYYQQAGIVNYISWDTTPEFGSLFVKLVIFFVIGIIIWLSNREVEKALARARRSEKNLKKERDLLEERVEERTKQLQKEQMEKILHLYRFADFGRLAAGMFHDLITPLTMVSMNLEKLQAKNKDADPINEVSIQRAVSGTKTMEGFVKTIRTQIKQQNTQTKYNPCEQIEKAIEGLRHKAKKSKVTIKYEPCDKCQIMGNPLRFYQVASNIISNSIDSYEGVRRKKDKKAIVQMECDKKSAKFSVTDFGSGISKKNLSRIFDPFYTTKSPDKNMGIGLSISKDIVEKELKGKISINSKPERGSTFTVEFPINTKQ